MNQQYKNPALREEPIGEPAAIIAPRENESILKWLQNTGRFVARQSGILYQTEVINELEDILYQEEELDEEE
jgi:hypothetical protein